MKRNSLLLILLTLPTFFFSQSLTVIDNYLKINAAAKDPLYTTYAATMSRSALSEDVFYKMDYYSDSCLVNYSGNGSGTMFSFWKIDDVLVKKTSDYFREPVVIYSFPDMMIMEYQPASCIQVRETFLVYSSTLSVVEMEIRSTDTQPHEVSIFPVLDFGNDSVEDIEYNREYAGILANRIASSRKMINSKEIETNRPINITEFFTASPRILSYKYYHSTREDFYKSLMNDSAYEEKPDSQNLYNKSSANFFVLYQKRLIRPKETISFRYIRGTQRQQEDPGQLMKEAVNLKGCFLKTFFEDNLMLFLNIPKIKFGNPGDKLLYISALNLARNSIFPASGNSRFNFFSSSRDRAPDKDQELQLWQEAPGLMGYVYIDPKSAENAFRLLKEQAERGKPLRFHQRDSSRSLPFYNWIGMEIYKVSGERQFLKEIYVSGGKYVDRLILENLSTTENDPDLALLISIEARCLAWMAKEIGKTTESVEWSKKSSIILNQDSMVSPKPYEKLLWNYIDYIGMKNNGYDDIAKQLSTKMKFCVSTQLSKNHEFREFYSPDADTAIGIKNYFPDSIIAKLLIEENVK